MNPRTHIYFCALAAIMIFQSAALGQETAPTAAEYFVDTDPGHGSGTPVTLSSDSSSTNPFTFSTTGLQNGKHRVFVRPQTQDGTWGTADSRGFYVLQKTTHTLPAIPSPVADAEYFIDTDPGHGLGTPLSIPSDTSASVQFSFSTTGLSPGKHRVYIRARNAEGTWGTTETRAFHVLEPVVQTTLTTSPLSKLEYFVGEDPGYGSGTEIAIPEADSVDVTRAISTTGLSSGSHSVYVRAQNTEGIWGTAESAAFTILPGSGSSSPAPNIQLFSNLISFGQITVGASSSVSFVIENKGDAELSVTNIASDNTNFTVTETALTIAAKSSQNITVTFTPDALGGRTGILTISSNDSDSGTLTVTMTGTGEESKGPAPVINLTATLLDFGETVLGQSTPLTLTLQNTGDADLSVSNITSSSAQFAVSATTAIIPQGGSQTVTVTYAPTDEGSHTGTLTISSNDPDNVSRFVTLTGTGVTPPTPSSWDIA